MQLPLDEIFSGYQPRQGSLMMMMTTTTTTEMVLETSVQ
jgi:hypothetical protein